MKKLSKLLLVFVMVVSLMTGCVKYNVNMEVKDDKSVTLEIVYGMDMSGFGDFTDEESEEETDDNDSGINTEDYKFLEDAGFKVEEYTETKDDSKISGVKITRTFKNIDDITSDKKVSLDFNKLFDGEDKKYDENTKYFYKDGNKYVANFIFDLSTDDEDNQSMSAIADQFDLKYSVKLPKKSESNNATEVSEDGKTLTWKLKYGKKNEINYDFVLGASSSLTTYIVIGAVAAVVVVAIIAVLVSKKKKPETTETVENNTTE